MLIFSACGPGDSSNPKESEYGSQADALRVCAQNGTLPGVDVSVYQGNINWGQVAGSGIKWGYAKATEGTSYRDPTFGRNRAGMRANGIAAGAYHFFHPGIDGTAQADFFLSSVGSIGAGDLPAMLDWEVSDGVSGATAGQNAQRFIDRIQARTGRQTVVYTSPGLWSGFHVPGGFGGNPMWVAYWTFTTASCPSVPSGWNNWVFWQWSDRGSVPGISGRVDLDVFNGNAGQLAAFTGAPACTGGGRPGLLPRPPSCGSIPAGDGLGPGDSVSACGGCFNLVMQTDGNLVLYRNNGQALWSTSTNGGYAFDMQGDGNAVLYSDVSCPLWTSNTGGRSGAFLALQDDGNVVVYAPGGAAVWASNTDVCPGGCQCYPPVTISPSSTNVAPRGSLGFSASGGSGGFSWSIASNPSGGSINGGGGYTAGANGSVTDIVRVADSTGHTGTATVNVGPGLSITPASSTVPPRSSVAFSATGGSGAGFTWSLPTAASGGSITAAGVYKAGPRSSVSDTVQVVDSLGNVTTTTVSIGPGVSVAPVAPTVPPRGSVTFAATGGGGTGFKWSVVTMPPNGVIGSSGVYTAGVVGNVSDAVQVVDALGNSAITTVNVGPGVSVTPASSASPPGGSVAFSATGGSGAGFTWSVLTPLTGASISSAGVYTAGRVGSVVDTVQGTDSLGNTAVAQITVGPPVTVLPAAAMVVPRQSMSFAAAGGSGLGFAWALAMAPSGGSVTSGGVYTAGTVGDVMDTVQVTDSLGNTALVPVSVGPAVSITPATITVAPRQPLKFSARGGSNTGFAWSMTTADSGGTISPTGQYKAGTTPNTADVVAVIDSLGNVAAAQVTIGPGVSVTPPASAVPPRGSLMLSAVGGSGTGFDWSISTNHSGGVVTHAGGYTAGPVSNVTDTLQVVDSLGNPASIDVTVGPGASITPGMTRVAPMASATFVASGGSGVGYAWTVPVAPSGGSITDAGVYTAGVVANTVDVVSVMDSLGNVATARIIVGTGLSISAPPSTVPPRGSFTFAATGGSGVGEVWSLPIDPSGGTITSAGVYTAGTTPDAVDMISVTDSLGNTASVQVLVGPGVTVTPAGATVGLMESVTFSAGGGSGEGFVWSLSDAPSGGTISSAGVYQAGPHGNVVDAVQVSDSLGNQASVDITVGSGLIITPSMSSVAPRQSVAFAAIGGSHAGYVWTLSLNTSGGSVTAEGVYTAGKLGKVTDRLQVVDSQGNQASVEINVGAEISVAPATPSVAPRGSVNFSATGGSNAGYLWSLTSSPSGGLITSTGVYTAGSISHVSDAVQVVDSLGNVGTAEVSVGQGVTITPGSATVAVGQQVSFTASGGSGVDYGWSLTTNASGGHIAGDGLYLPGNVGGVSDTVQLIDSVGNVATAVVHVTALQADGGEAKARSAGCGCAGEAGPDLLALTGLLLGRLLLGQGRRRRPASLSSESGS